MAGVLCTLIVLTALFSISHQEGGQGEDIGININILYRPEVCKQQAKPGDYVSVTYVAFLPTESGNEQFDTSDNKGPVHFRLHDPESTAMQGWHEAVDGMCLTEKREVLIPAGELTMNHHLPNSKVPPAGKDIVYRFELHSLKDTPPSENLFKKMDFNGNKEITKDELHQYIEAEGLGGIKEFGSQERAVNHMFKEMDRNKDGVITHEEFPGPKHDEF